MAVKPYGKCIKVVKMRVNIKSNNNMNMCCYYYCTVNIRIWNVCCFVLFVISWYPAIMSNLICRNIHLIYLRVQCAQGSEHTIWYYSCQRTASCPRWHNQFRHQKFIWFLCAQFNSKMKTESDGALPQRQGWLTQNK